MELPPEPLQIAYRGLYTTDTSLRGTALEYLDSVLPPDIREHLWPFIDEGTAPGRVVRPNTDVLEDLLRSNGSILINLREQQRRGRV